MSPRGTPERLCGECGECCKVLAVKEIGKPSDVPCPHLVPGRAGGCCGIYDDQPAVCARFKCGWLIGNFADEFKPDRVGIVVYQVNSEVGRGICLAESRPGTLEGDAAREIAAEVESAGMLVIKREAHHEMRREG